MAGYHRICMPGGDAILNCHCPVCGIEMWFSESLFDQRAKTSRPLWCPNGDEVRPEASPTPPAPAPPLPEVGPEQETRPSPRRHWWRPGR